MEGKWQLYKQYTDDCMREAGPSATAKEKETMKKLVVDNDPKVEATEKVSCFALCILKKFNMVNDLNNFNEGVAMSMAKTEDAKIAINLCKGKTAPKPCQKGLALYECFNERQIFPNIELIS